MAVTSAGSPGQGEARQALGWRPLHCWAVLHCCAKSICWCRAASGGFSTYRKIHICILPANRKTRILWGNSCFPFSCQPLKHLSSTFSKSLSVLFIQYTFWMKSAFYRSLYLTIFFVSSNNCPESKAMFLTQLVLHDEGVLKEFWHSCWVGLKPATVSHWNSASHTTHTATNLIIKKGNNGGEVVAVLMWRQFHSSSQQKAHRKDAVMNWLWWQVSDIL